MSAALQTLAKFRRLAESHKVDEIVAAATSATREAENGGDFIAEVARQTGIRIRVISGTEEARLIHLAAGYGVDVGGSTAVVIDIGGGSVEVTLGNGDAPDARQELQDRRHPPDRTVRQDRSALGARRTAAREVSEPGDGDLPRTDREAPVSIASSEPRARSSASGRSRLTDDERRTARRTCEISACGAKALHRLRKRLVDADIEERLHMPGLDPRRADLNVAGSVLLDTILRGLGTEDLTLCDLALREGLVLDYIHRNSARIRKVERYPDVRRRSVVELGERCGYWSEHAQQVARLALSIFDQTRSVHGLGDREREWLEYAALLHDVGVHISYDRHHRHSYYLIKNGDLRGFEPQEIEVIALVARYHRQATPKKSHEGYGDLNGTLRSDRAGAVGNRSARRGARSQPRAGARRDRSLSPRRRLPRASARQRRRRAGTVGRASTRRAARARAGAADSFRSLGRRVQGTTISC